MESLSTFAAELSWNESTGHEVVISVDAVELSELVESFERQEGRGAAGGYGGLVVPPSPVGLLGDFGTYLTGEDAPWPG